MEVFKCSAVASSGTSRRASGFKLGVSAPNRLEAFMRSSGGKTVGPLEKILRLSKLTDYTGHDMGPTPQLPVTIGMQFK